VAFFVRGQKIQDEIWARLSRRLANMKTAKMLGVDLAMSVLGFATEVIE
jgi:hypothetical protein